MEETSADKNDPKIDITCDSEVFCMFSCLDEDMFDSYQNSDELSATKITLSEVIFTVWEIE